VTGISVRQNRDVNLHVPTFNIAGICDGGTQELDSEPYIKAFTNLMVNAHPLRHILARRAVD
jgi:hypothetical protein